MIFSFKTRALALDLIANHKKKTFTQNIHSPTHPHFHMLYNFVFGLVFVFLFVLFQFTLINTLTNKHTKKKVHLSHWYLSWVEIYFCLKHRPKILVDHQYLMRVVLTPGKNVTVSLCVCVFVIKFFSSFFFTFFVVKCFVVLYFSLSVLKFLSHIEVFIVKNQICLQIK